MAVEHRYVHEYGSVPQPPSPTKPTASPNSFSSLELPTIPSQSVHVTSAAQKVEMKAKFDLALVHESKNSKQEAVNQLSTTREGVSSKEAFSSALSERSNNSQKGFDLAPKDENVNPPSVIAGIKQNLLTSSSALWSTASPDSNNYYSRTSQQAKTKDALSENRSKMLPNSTVNVEKISSRRIENTHSILTLKKDSKVLVRSAIVIQVE